jgi:hypothetical protein
LDSVDARLAASVSCETLGEVGDQRFVRFGLGEREGLGCDLGGGFEIALGGEDGGVGVEDVGAW